MMAAMVVPMVAVTNTRATRAVANIPMIGIAYTA